jgi:hypothetical protein
MTTPTHTDAPKTMQSVGWSKLGAALLALGTVQFFVMHLIVQNAWAEPP